MSSDPVLLKQVRPDLRYAKININLCVKYSTLLPIPEPAGVSFASKVKWLKRFCTDNCTSVAAWAPAEKGQP